jgi:DNA-directed RNA polymerase subunit alpha
MLSPNFKMITEKDSDSYGKFIFEPLESGYGHTLGTSLRRVLLTSIQGSAPTSIKINGVSNQFTTIPGMKETVAEFLLNVKRLRLKYYGNEKTKIKFNVTGPGAIHADAIECPSDVEVINKDLVLCHLADKKSKIAAEITVTSGYGYVTADEQEREGFGIIPIDSMFSPIMRVNYAVEDTRVGRVTNFDKLTLEVWTDGSIKPSQTILDAAKLLIAYFDQIVNPQTTAPKPDSSVVSIATPGVLKMTVEEFDLPTRIINSLNKAGIKTIEDLISLKRSELINIKNMGAKSLAQIEEKLKEKGIVLS